MATPLSARFASGSGMRPKLFTASTPAPAPPWDYARGWVEQFVAAENPDLILTDTNGSPQGGDGEVVVEGFYIFEPPLTE